MPEESKESKAKKLAAARKKLKEYQQRGSNADIVTSNVDSSSNVSERSVSDLQLNDSNIDMGQAVTPQNEGGLAATPSHYFTEPNTPPTHEIMSSRASPSPLPTYRTEERYQTDGNNINAIQVLITEKSQLTSELNKYRTTCREKDLELEELRVQHSNVCRRVDDLQQNLKDLQKQAEQHRTHNAELQHKLAQARALNEDQSSHLLELQQQMQLREERLKILENDFKNKCNELELADLKIRQLSDESTITKDDRVETLTQTQFMYEQQIRDLQAMIQQHQHDKEQANTQYQTYVQQLNAQVNQLNERNNELMEECSKLRDRDKQLVEHVQQMEKEIQRNITRQAEIKEEKQTESSTTTINTQQILDLQERVQEFETERYEFQLKIKSQEDRLHELQNECQQKQVEIEELREHLENVTSEQPDKTKLLATMESDKVAASRAMSQNVALKKQLDELEIRFVQLTNDKADLMNRLDAEQYSNREMRVNYATMEKRIQEMDERFKFKDEEMIRLSHENEELKKKLSPPHKRSNGEKYHDEDGHTMQHEHHECHDHHREGGKDNEHHHIVDDHCHQHNDESAGRLNNDDNECCSHTDTCHEAIEEQGEHINNPCRNQTPTHIATEEAVEKLQKRFTHLMSQVADLTEEKQRLEHLVMQLQSETETIGEYIALYQTQRRILKQREYEKAAQTALLLEEREQMRNRLTMLNNLVNSLGMEIPLTQQQHQLHQQLNDALAQSISQTSDSTDSVNNQHDLPNDTNDGVNSTVSISPQTSKDLNSFESQQILHKIQDIISEIKENTKELPTVHHSVDHLNCCSGKFEVV
ncbi:Golgi matrix protein 130 kD isoform X2 [Haematobia irritans]|uniref:Golgi matrix protein 130 kD isoform X2 n=1 Tax=Haematobia irritans TaxID=7368 RepID=UPI003F4FE6A4